MRGAHEKLYKEAGHEFDFSRIAMAKITIEDITGIKQLYLQRKVFAQRPVRKLS